MSTNLQVEERTALKRLDLNLILVVFALNMIGLINVYSATHGASTLETSRLFVQQILWIGVGWSFFFIATFLDYRIFVRFSWILYIVNLGALLFAMAFGKVALGAQRWIDLGFFRYQSSETMKLALILLMANLLARRSVIEGLGLKEMLQPMTVALVPFAITVEQPDLGTAMMLMAIAVSLVFFVRIRPPVLISAIMLMLVVLPLAWNFGLKEYQRNRVLTFLEPTRDPRGAGYNSIQSRIAVGSGKVLGKGFRKGTQSQLEFLPEQHTDFIFSVLSEEHGFVGGVTTVGLFAALLILGVRIATQAREKIGALLVVGVLSMIFWHMFVNIGMVTGLLPIVGIPLPLVSYGGSSMLTNMLALGLVSSVSLRKYLF